jgi:GDP-4-dehydro-6-deoxy-D-mannose reductase
MKTLVTGSNGFVGRHFCAQHGGVALNDQEGEVDLRDAVRVRDAVQSIDPEAVLHLAAQSSVAASFSHPEETFAVNFFGTLNLLQALSAIGYQGTFVYVGSADVYGCTSENDLPTRETQPLRPRSPYAVSKVAAEALCYQWSQTGNFRIVLVRPFNLIGPGQSIRFALSDFANQIAQIRRGNRKPSLVTGALDVTRDFTDVRDAVRAYNMLLEEGQSGEIYNICSGQERSLRSMVEKLISIAGIKVELETSTARLRPTEQQRAYGDPGKIYAHLGWKAEIPVEETLSEILRETEKSI